MSSIRHNPLKIWELEINAREVIEMSGFGKFCIYEKSIHYTALYIVTHLYLLNKFKEFENEAAWRDDPPLIYDLTIKSCSGHSNMSASAAHNIARNYVIEGVTRTHNMFKATPDRLYPMIWCYTPDYGMPMQWV